MDLRYYAIAAQVLFYFYWLATEWIDFFPWNDIKSAQRSDQIRGTIFHSSMTALCACTFVSGIKWLMWIAIAWFTLLLTVEICNWWIPYLFGIYPAEINKQVYAEHFSRTYRFLPPIKDHNVVDAQHVVVIFLTAIMLGVSVWALLA